VLQDPRKVMKPKEAKNIILFLGDGMSLATVAATRMYMGNENNKLSFEKFELKFHMKWFPLGRVEHSKRDMNLPSPAVSRTWLVRFFF